MPILRITWASNHQRITSVFAFRSANDIIGKAKTTSEEVHVWTRRKAVSGAG
jgi:hypothetical protein